MRERKGGEKKGISDREEILGLGERNQESEWRENLLRGMVVGENKRKGES